MVPQARSIASSNPWLSECGQKKKITSPMLHSVDFLVLIYFIFKRPKYTNVHIILFQILGIYKLSNASNLFPLLALKIEHWYSHRSDTIGKVYAFHIKDQQFDPSCNIWSLNKQPTVIPKPCQVWHKNQRGEYIEDWNYDSLII